MKASRFCLLSIVLLAMSLGLSMQADAKLTTIGTATYNSSDYNLIYDDDLGMTWLDYSLYPNPQGTARGWASNLNNAGVLTYDLNPGVTMSWSGDWRLPATVDGPYVWGYDGTTTAGYNITSSEMGHLFYTALGNKGSRATDGTIQTGSGLTNTGDFQNLISASGMFWSGTRYSADPSNAWFFSFSDGSQAIFDKDWEYDLSALAVRSSNVTIVPEPISSMLFVIGGAILGFRQFRKKFMK